MKTTTFPEPSFTNVTVHDPSVIKTDDTYYVFGSHLASAKSEDLMNWEQVSEGVHPGNPVIPNALEEMAETFEWAQTNTFWAADVIQLEDGRYYMYYNACKGDSPRSAMGIAVSDNIEGPYEDLGIILKSGMWDQPSEDGKIYDATYHPNAVDPDTFFDHEGNLWMVYGSYSGGIFILKLDPKTGFPYEGQGYGKKLLGANHSRIEAPYMLYNPETNYYYLFLSYGGLDAVGGYNIRVARSENPDGPFNDVEGNDMIDAHGKPGTIFDDVSIEPYGAKLVGNFKFLGSENEEVDEAHYGYVSPGHNSAHYDEETNKYFNFFHTRFPDTGEMHEVRVHQMFFNKDGWPLLAPYRYGGETTGKINKNQVIGDYKFINHGKDISATLKESMIIELKKNGKIAGEVTGTWEQTGDYSVELTIDEMTYDGVFVLQYDDINEKHVMTFTALSENGTAIWGSKVE
uniref:glycoside hydrolase family 43 protein n=1 Tax=Litchfieldia alkalitelluris TaxID=304268 RepID=UPI001115FD79|nr:glycoside hydrolase family 43 protein [Litchfieldia alkalitelluris]